MLLCTNKLNAWHTSLLCPSIHSKLYEIEMEEKTCPTNVYDVNISVHTIETIRDREKQIFFFVAFS